MKMQNALKLPRSFTEARDMSGCNVFLQSIHKHIDSVHQLKQPNFIQLANFLFLFFLLPQLWLNPFLFPL